VAVQVIVYVVSTVAPLIENVIAWPAVADSSTIVSVEPFTLAEPIVGPLGETATVALDTVSPLFRIDLNETARISVSLG
jgi:hypothetical protein